MRCRLIWILGVVLLLPDALGRGEEDAALTRRVRVVAARDPEAARAACRALGLAGRPTVGVVTALRSALDRPDRAFAAAEALSRIGTAAAEAVPVLRDALDGDDRVAALRALGRYGPAARSAIPGIIDALCRAWMSGADEGALRTMGDDATRALIARLAATDGGAARRLEGVLARRGGIAPERVRERIERLATAHGCDHGDLAEEIAGLGRFAVSPLMRALDDERQPVRVGAILALGHLRFHAAAAVPRLETLVSSADVGVATSAARAIGRIGPAAAMARPTLRRALGADDPSVRVAAAFALWRLGESAEIVVPVLIRALREPEGGPMAPSSAAAALAWMGPSAAAAVPVLLAILAGEAGPPRADAAKALGRIWTEAPRIAPALARALGHERTWIREAAAGALAGMGRDASPFVPALVRALEDEDRRVRRVAARTLGHLVLDDERVVPALARRLTDEQDAVAMAAAQALARFGPAAAPAVTALLEMAKGDPSIGQYEVLAAIGAPAIPILVNALGSRDATLRSLAFDVAYWMRMELPPSAIPPLLGLLEEETPSQPAWAVAETLGRTGREAVRHLLRLAENEDPDRRVAAACGIGVLRECPAGARGTLLRLVADPDEDVRSTAVERVEHLAERGQLSAPEALPVLLDAFRAAAPEDRCWIASALGAFGPDGMGAVSPLTEGLRTGDADLARSVVAALARVGPAAASALPLLAGEVRAESASARVRAVRAIAAIATGVGPHLPVLRDALQDRDGKVRLAAARALLMFPGSRGPMRAVLLSSLRDASSTGRVVACEILGDGGFRDPEVVDALAITLGDPDEDTRIAAVRTLINIGPAAAPAVSHLIVLLRDWETGVHGGDHSCAVFAATALASIGPAAHIALPALERAARLGPDWLRPHASLALLAIRRR